MLGWIIAIAALLVLGFLAWRHFSEWFYSPAPAVPAMGLQQPQEIQIIENLKLPSSLASLKFPCKVTIDYIAGDGFPADQDPARAATWEILQVAQAISSQYPLTVYEHIDMALNQELHRTRHALKGQLTIRAHVEPVRPDIKDLALARELERSQFELERDDHLEGARMRRAEQLARLIADPQRAALWWLTNNPTRIEELPKITTMMINLDRQLNHPSGYSGDATATGEPTFGQDLDDLLAKADKNKRAQMGNALVFAYNQLGRPDLAERARSLTDLIDADQASTRTGPNIPGQRPGFP